MDPLVSAWLDAIDSFQRTVAEVPDEAFARPSLLPGWTVGDIIAHVSALEAELSGAPLPEHVPDWDALPHANDLFSRYTEIGVDYRRGWTPERLRAELADVARTRSDRLTSAPQDLDHLVAGVAGIERTFGRVLKMRCFDIFLHELDIRDALAMAAPDLGEAARVTVDLMADGLGYVWVKKAGAQRGQLLHFVVPEWLEAWVGVGEDGRGRMVDPGDATVGITMEPMDYIRLASGRRGDPGAARVEGDEVLGAAVLAALNVAP